MSDDEALAKVRARMAAWHAYVARPGVLEAPGEGQVILRENSRSAEGPPDAFGALHAGSSPAVGPESFSAPSYRYVIDPEFAHHTTLNETVETKVLFTDFPPLFGTGPGNAAAHTVGGPYSLAELESAAMHQGAAGTALEQERELTRRLVETIAREQELIAREQLLRVFFYQNDPETKRSEHPVQVADRWSMERQHRASGSSNWEFLLAWMIILGACIIAVLIVYLLY